MDQKNEDVLRLLRDIKQELLGIALILTGGFLMVPAVLGGNPVWWIGVTVLFFFGFLEVWVGFKAGDFKK